LQNAKNETNGKLLSALNHPWVDSALAVWEIKDFTGTILHEKYPFFLYEKNVVDGGSLEWDVGLLVYLLLPFKALIFHAEDGNNGNRKECKTSLVFVKRGFFLSHY